MRLRVQLGAPLADRGYQRGCSPRKKDDSYGATLKLMLRTASISFICTLVALGMLIVRGTSGWSHSFGVMWFTLLVIAVALGIAAIATAFGSRGAALERRGLALALSLPAVCLAGLVVLFLVIAIELAPSLN
jgi:hypothetical protein